jgi:Kef-type K+ transport system membrane component KefB
VVEAITHISLLVLIAGIVIFIGPFMRIAFEHMRLPFLIGFILFGFLLRLFDLFWNFLTPDYLVVFGFLSRIGLITILFWVGIGINIVNLRRQMKRAGFIWAFDFIFNAAAGFVITWLVLEIALIPSMFISLALAVTSVGIAGNMLRQRRLAQSATVGLLLNVAELDDMLGMVLLAILLPIAPLIQHHIEISSAHVIETASLVIFKLALLIIGCIIFSILLERRLVDSFKMRRPHPNYLLVLTGTAFLIAGTAGLLGFPTVIGAFLAGLVFNRNAERPYLTSAFESAYEMLGPFFYVGIGLSVNPETVFPAAGLGVILLAVAVLGKLMGAGLPALLVDGKAPSLILGVGMMPRAEISMLIMRHGLNLGQWAVSQQIFAAMVLVSVGTCTISPTIIRMLLRRWTAG